MAKVNDKERYCFNKKILDGLNRFSNISWRFSNNYKYFHLLFVFISFVDVLPERLLLQPWVYSSTSELRPLPAFTFTCRISRRPVPVSYNNRKIRPPFNETRRFYRIRNDVASETWNVLILFLQVIYFLLYVNFTTRIVYFDRF